jgi:hypothetical protein
MIVVWQAWTPPPGGVGEATGCRRRSGSPCVSVKKERRDEHRSHLRDGNRWNATFIFCGFVAALTLTVMCSKDGSDDV